MKTKLEIPEYIKQQFFADALDIEKGNFSRIKAGDKPLNPGRAAKLAGLCRALQADLENYIDYLYGFIPFDEHQNRDKYDDIEEKYLYKIFDSLSGSYKKDL